MKILHHEEQTKKYQELINRTKKTILKRRNKKLTK